MEIKGVHHFSIVVNDIDKSLYFYNEMGHLKINNIDHSDEKDVYHLQIPDDGELELIDFKGKQINDPISARTVRFHHIAIHVDDPKDYYERFLPFVEEWPFRLSNNDTVGHYAACPNDPDGVMIEWLSPYEPIPNNYKIKKDFTQCPGYHHFCIYVNSRDESFKLYRDVLGLKLVREVFNIEFTGAPAEAFYLQVPGSGELEIIDNRGLQMMIPVNSRRTGASTMAFKVDDAEEFYKMLTSNGYDACMENGICKMIDPNGVFLEFIEC